MKPSLGRRLVSEFLGSTLLLAAVVGSGIMAEKLAAGTHRARTAGKLNRHGRGARRHHSRAGVHLWASPESCRNNRRRTHGRAHVERRPALHRRALRRRISRRDCNARNVRPPTARRLDSCAQRRRSGLQRVRRELGSTGCHLGLRSPTPGSNSVRRRRIHHRGLLVYELHFLRESGCHTGALPDRYLCRNPSDGCSSLHGRPTHRSDVRDTRLSMAASSSAGSSVAHL